MSVVEIHPEELFDKLAQGTLTTAEGERLRAHLGGCDVCRFELAARGDFSAADVTPRASNELEPNTPARPQRPNTASPNTRRARRVAFVWIAAAAALLMATGALASVLSGKPPWRLFEPANADEPESAAPSDPRARASRSTAKVAAALPSSDVPTELEAPATLAAAPALPSALPAPSPPAGTRASAGTRATTRDPGGSPMNALALFADANKARAGGEHTRAVKLYRQLQREFPQSAEAVLSQLTLSTLLLHTGDARGALAGFNVYLARSTRPLEAEALVGRALALRSLGQTDAEVAAWQAVLKRYPGSSYARRAADRLAALGRL